MIQLEKQLARETRNDDASSTTAPADDWTIVHGDRSVGTKQEDAAHKSKYDTATFDDIKVRVYGEARRGRALFRGLDEAASDPPFPAGLRTYG